MPAGIVYFIVQVVWTRSIGKVMNILIPSSNRVISFTVIFMLTSKETRRILKESGQSFLAKRQDLI